MSERSFPPPLDLGDRLLWVDGDVTVTPDKVPSLVLKLSSVDRLKKLTVTELTPEVQRYNQLSPVPLRVKESINSSLFPPGWVLPERYKYRDLDEYLIELAERVEKDDLYDKRIERLAVEYELFKVHQLEDVLRMLIYVIDTLTEKKVVWGVGRGSSCSSYLLYLMGLHCVDPVRYEIEITDFLRPEVEDAEKREDS